MIDKSIRQHYENGKEVDPYAGGRKLFGIRLNKSIFLKMKRGLMKDNF